jgi:hypothetical protein
MAVEYVEEEEDADDLSLLSLLLELGADPNKEMASVGHPCTRILPLWPAAPPFGWHVRPRSIAGNNESDFLLCAPCTLDFAKGALKRSDSAWGLVGRSSLL